MNKLRLRIWSAKIFDGADLKKKEVMKEMAGVMY